MIEDILPSPKGQNPKKSSGATEKKEKQITVSFSHFESTKKLLHELVWLKKFAIDLEEVSQGDIIREALELLAEKIDYEKLRKKYAKQLEKAKPRSGRKKR